MVHQTYNIRSRILALPAVIATTMDQILEQTGMMGIVMLVGRDPKANDQLLSML